jgi:hypothetical protein
MNIPSPIRNVKASRRTATVSWMICLISAAALFAQAQSTDDSSTDYSTFEIIAQRNIFDPNRYPHTPGYVPSRREGTPTFSLAGTMSYRKGMYAFFTGTRSDYQKAVQEGGTIGSFTVTKINFEGVELQNAGKKIDMKVGSAMRQEGDGWDLSLPGEWSPSSSPISTETDNSSTNETAPAALPSSSAPNDILKRLMEQREQIEQQK